MTRIRTSLLVVLLIATTTVAGIAASRLGSARQRAELAASDLATCHQQLVELRARTAQSSGVKPAQSPGGVSDLLRQAASSANIAAQLTGIEPGQPVRIEGTDYSQTPIFLRLDAMPIKQLVTFLHESASRDPAARCRSIELSAAPGGDLWSADVTIGYVSYAPAGDPNRRRENRGRNN